MTIELTEEQIKALQNGEDITIKAPCKERKEFPQDGDKYWFIFDERNIESYYWEDCEVSICRLDYGNIYQTEDEAIKARDIQLAKTRVKRAIAKANDGWEPDWENQKENKYLIMYSYSRNRLIVEYYTFLRPQTKWMFIKSEEIAKQILEEYKEDLELIFSE